MNRVGKLGILVWALHLALPMLGLWLLIAQPQFDIHWQHEPTHFWLIAGFAAINSVLGTFMSEAARRRADARLFFVALAFLSSAGFLLLHALATPTVLIPNRNAGFIIATPVGLFVAALFAVASSLEFSPQRANLIMRWQVFLRGGLLLLMLIWAAISLLNLPPLNAPIAAESAYGELAVLAVAGIAIYSIAALRYYLIYRRRRSVMLIAVITAFALLAESMIAIVVARNWNASWWLWHLMMGISFGFVAYSAYVQYRREGSAAGLFNSIYLEQTIAQIRAEYTTALEALVGAFRQQAESDAAPPVRLAAARLRERFDLTEGQTEVLAQAAEALAAEREQLQRLEALVAIGQASSVILEEHDLLQQSLALTTAAFRRDQIRIGVLNDRQLRFLTTDRSRAIDPAVAEVRRQTVVKALRGEPIVEAAVNGVVLLALPLIVKRHTVGVLEVVREHGPIADRDRWLLRSFATQLSIALENVRLYRQIEALFRQYMAPSVATTLLANPSQAALGGAITELTVLFADLRGFTAFSERSSPEEVVALLNHYFGIATPLVLAEGGTVDKFVGDAMMALFNAPVRQPDHALRAVRAALAMQAAIEQIAADNAGWPRFRIGINTGSALVGNIGSAELRNFTAIGDTVNLASRLETSAESGQIVIGAATYAHIRDIAVVRELGGIAVKGKAAPVEAFVLLGLRQPSVEPDAADEYRARGAGGASVDHPSS
jgi:class 3 adenylate cyclase